MGFEIIIRSHVVFIYQLTGFREIVMQNFIKSCITYVESIIK
jgi:hypothetical protein